MRFSAPANQEAFPGWLPKRKPVLGHPSVNTGRILNGDKSGPMGSNPTIRRAKLRMRHLDEEPLSAMFAIPLLMMNHFSIMPSLAAFFRAKLGKGHFRQKLSMTIVALFLLKLPVFVSPVMLSFISNYH
jgi:hypothetical protein